MTHVTLIPRNATDFDTRRPPFYFMTAIGEYTGRCAVSLCDFLEQIKHVDPQALEFHVSRRDFQRWILNRWQFDALVDDLDLLQRRGLVGECLRQQLINVVAIHTYL
jgi:hypothetical protein